MKKYPIYQLDELDLQLLFMVHQQLFQYYKDEASYVLATSSLPQRLQDDPYYIHHYDEQYWCKYVYRKHEQRKSEERVWEKSELIVWKGNSLKYQKPMLQFLNFSIVFCPALYHTFFF